MAGGHTDEGREERSHRVRFLGAGLVFFWLLAALGWSAFAYRALTERAEIQELRTEVRRLQLDRSRTDAAAAEARRALEGAQAELAAARQELDTARQEQAALRDQLAARERAVPPPASPPAAGRRPTR